MADVAHAKEQALSKTIGIIGAGQMGAGIAQVAAASGHKVILVDREPAIAEKAKAGITKRLARLVEKEKIALADADAALARIRTGNEYAPMADAAFIIEAATENEQVKAMIFAEAAKVLATDAILASNTSSISITRMAAGVPDPSRFVGLHFFNPVPVMKLVEVIPGLATSTDVRDRTRAFAESLGKEVVLSEDEPGFVVNRILLPMINEAVFVLGSGTAAIADIDKACRLGLAHPMGPLELADFIGLDTCLEIMRVIHAGTGDSKYRAAPLLVKYVEAGWLGRKTGKGFYEYSGDEPVPTR
ncbi:3-hydroxyacyl-CoA dehydrogenase NAD-binding domain-containing protein [Alteraurantiacibacter aestuarii]|uniref:3-hydroxybutyryl-CoA dehydrogenase n=1 Tax=Alteraurantiacibacter aestuarii TaxID=650004 RepID=A0A844ZJ40_9SPHN|nr:3-hydroxyacyl-CoA dehydrogenase NAD-binding domain-containing protein [Alteraurantiacibacter aestuarii]MXO87166.1 3-hydroxybutyryl-CoA dehydrogenase [Alteraurantiacibacter aestuarii]